MMGFLLSCYVVLERDLTILTLVQAATQNRAPKMVNLVTELKSSSTTTL